MHNNPLILKGHCKTAVPGLEPGMLQASTRRLARSRVFLCLNKLDAITSPMESSRWRVAVSCSAAFQHPLNPWTFRLIGTGRGVLNTRLSRGYKPCHSKNSDTKSPAQSPTSTHWPDSGARYPMTPQNNAATSPYCLRSLAKRATNWIASCNSWTVSQPDLIQIFTKLVIGLITMIYRAFCV